MKERVKSDYNLVDSQKSDILSSVRALMLQINNVKWKKIYNIL